MISIISLVGIIISLFILIYFAYKGHSIIWVAPLCAVVVAVMSGLNILDAYLNDYIKGMAEYVISWFPAFFLGAVYGKIMDMTGSARSLANKLVSLLLLWFILWDMRYIVKQICRAHFCREQLHLVLLE